MNSTNRNAIGRGIITHPSLSRDGIEVNYTVENHRVVSVFTNDRDCRALIHLLDDPHSPAHISVEYEEPTGILSNSRYGEE